MIEARLMIEAFRGEVDPGQVIDLPCCDWIVGLEVVTPQKYMHFALVDVNDTVMALLPHVATLPQPDPVTGSVTYYCGPYLNRSGACPVRLKVHSPATAPLTLIVKGLIES